MWAHVALCLALTSSAQPPPPSPPPPLKCEDLVADGSACAFTGGGTICYNCCVNGWCTSSCASSTTVGTMLALDGLLADFSGRLLLAQQPGNLPNAVDELCPLPPPPSAPPPTAPPPPRPETCDCPNRDRRLAMASEDASGEPDAISDVISVSEWARATSALVPTSSWSVRLNSRTSPQGHARLGVCPDASPEAPLREPACAWMLDDVKLTAEITEWLLGAGTSA